MSHRESYSKAAKAAAKKIKKRTPSTPPPKWLWQCVPGDVVLMPWLGKVQITFFQQGWVAVRQWSPPTRDRNQRGQIRMLSGALAIKPIECNAYDCIALGQDCPACDGSRVIGLWY